MARRRRLPSVPPRKRARYSNAAIQNTRKGVRGRAPSNMGEQTITADTAVPVIRTSSVMPLIDLRDYRVKAADDPGHSGIVDFVPQKERNMICARLCLHRQISG